MRSKYYSYFLVDVLLTPLFPTSVTRCLSVTHWCFVIPIIFSSYRIVSSVYYSNESNILFSWSLSQSAVSRLSLYILEKSARVFPMVTFARKKVFTKPQQRTTSFIRFLLFSIKNNCSKNTLCTIRYNASKTR